MSLRRRGTKLKTYTNDEIRANRKLWRDAIASGKYKKGRTSLRSKDDKYCCLGIAAELFEDKHEFDEGVHYYGNNQSCLAPKSVIKALGLFGQYGSNRSGSENLTGINDNSNTFQPVLDAIDTGDYYIPLIDSPAEEE